MVMFYVLISFWIVDSNAKMMLLLYVTDGLNFYANKRISISNNLRSFYSSNKATMNNAMSIFMSIFLVISTFQTRLKHQNKPLETCCLKPSISWWEDSSEHEQFWCTSPASKLSKNSRCSSSSFSIKMFHAWRVLLFMPIHETTMLGD